MNKLLATFGIALISGFIANSIISLIVNTFDVSDSFTFGFAFAIAVSILHTIKSKFMPNDQL